MKARRSSGAPISFDHHGSPRKGGVALLLYQHQGVWHFPLMKRQEYPGIHSGQISLPGGKMESFDQSLIDTALRESHEELGLQVPIEDVVGNLSELYIIASHFEILPVVAVMKEPPIFKPDPREVDQVLVCSLEGLMRSSSKKEIDMMVRGYDIRAPYFEIENQVVWGATAMILNEFLVVVDEILH